MKKVRGKIMGDAMISKCCANFLSDVDIKPGIAQSGGALNKHGHQHIRFTDRYACWSESNLRLPNRSNMVAGFLRRERSAIRATLDVDYSWFRFRESKNGFSMMTLWGRQLPASICAAVEPGQYRLLDLIDFSAFKPLFFVRANPEIHSLKNVVRTRKVKKNGWAVEKVRCKALLVTMRDRWTKENWRYWTPEDGYISTYSKP